jgi:hypothetical protein
MIPVLHSVENLWITSDACGNSRLHLFKPVDEGLDGSSPNRVVDKSVRSRSTSHTDVVPVSRHASTDLSTVPTGVKKMTEKELMGNRSITFEGKCEGCGALGGRAMQGTSMGEPKPMSRERQ